MALSSDPIVFGVGSPLVPGDQSGIGAAVTGRFVYLAPIKPTLVRKADSLPGPDTVESVTPTSLKVLAFGLDVGAGATAIVNVLQGSAARFVATVLKVGNTFMGAIPKL